MAPAAAAALAAGVPEPVASGQPGCGYPFPWAVFRWIDGETYAPDRVDDERVAALELADFVLELRRLDPAGMTRSGRRPIAQLDSITRAAIEASAGAIDVAAALAAWDDALRAPVWDEVPVWKHGDLLPTNILVHGGALKAVIDWGGAGAGDPALDVDPAWSVFGPVGRDAFRDALDVDDGTWARARGFALHQAAMIIPYYAETNPSFVAMATRTVAAVLADLAG